MGKNRARIFTDLHGVNEMIKTDLGKKLMALRNDHIRKIGKSDIKNWTELGLYLASTTIDDIADIDKLIKTETDGKKRKSFLTRLYRRYYSLMSKRDISR